MTNQPSLKTVRQATVFVEKDGETTLAYWLQYRVAGKTKSMVAVFRPERCLVPRDKIALGFKHAEFDVTFGQMQTWLREKGYRLVGPVMEPE